MLKLYRVFGFSTTCLMCGHSFVQAFEPVREIYFRELHDALLFISTNCVGYWEIYCGSERVARSSFPEDI